MKTTIILLAMLATVVSPLVAQSPLNPHPLTQSLTEVQESLLIAVASEEASPVAEEEHSTNLEELLDFFQSDEFLQPYTALSAAPLSTNYGKIIATPSQWTYDDRLLYTLRFNGSLITSHNREQQTLYDQDSGQAYEPLQIYLKGVELYIQQAPGTLKPVDARQVSERTPYPDY
ncbi:MAG: hypothetical protein AAF804_05310 [Bacteroidota bacterium]